MKTSYFGRMNSKNFKGQSLNGVSIARSSRYWQGRTYPKLFPTWEMINEPDEATYEQMYREKILNRLNPVEVYEELGEDAILLCHEKYEDIEKGKTFCHRIIVARWLEQELEKRGIEIEIDELRDVKQELKGVLKGSKEKQLTMFDDSDWDADEDWDK